MWPNKANRQGITIMARHHHQKNSSQRHHHHGKTSPSKEFIKAMTLQQRGLTKPKWPNKAKMAYHGQKQKEKMQATSQQRQVAITSKSFMQIPPKCKERNSITHTQK